ncbi:hypothetical protein H0H92_009870 [Tricholoma furcatifolium]|nr:hypothetical protein H0H92_009870 [Tricholoma furcatifolium]
MHNDVKNLVLHFPRDGIDVSRVLGDISERMPDLSKLDLRSSVLPFEVEFARLISSLRNLKCITLPTPCLTSMITKTVSRLEFLEHLDFSYDQGPAEATDLSSFQPRLSKSSFPALKKLVIRIPYENALKLLVNLAPSSPSNLTLIYLQTRTNEHPAVVYRVVAAVANACPLLQYLQLNYVISGTTTIENTLPAPAKERCISIRTLRPLFNCKDLRSLSVKHSYPLDLQPADIEQIATSWTAIQSLLLNSKPLHLGPTDLTLDALVTIARHCPELSALAIFLNADCVPVGPSAQSQLHSFKSLKTLYFGASSIKEEGPVSVFLSRICQKDSLIRSVDNRFIGDDEALKLWGDKWKKVNELLPLLTGLRMEERDRSLHLYKAVERDLRAEVQRLQNKLSELSS